MRFVSFRAGGRRSYGVLEADRVFDLGARFGGAIPDLVSYLRLRALDAVSPPHVAADGYALDDIVFDPVIPAPRKIICVALNYEEHRQETGRAKSARPALFTRFADTLVGHRGAIRRPGISTELDYEGELAVIIGRDAWRVSRADAWNVVAGYACFNDASVRDWQRHTHQYTPGKNFPATGGFGPALVTPDELPGLADLAIETRLNGIVVQAATLGDMIFPVDELIAYITAFTPLAAGDVIATGTPGGVGFKREPPLFMKAGERVEVVIAGVGHLVNDVEEEKAADETRQGE
jgi:2-keto-4-pentenoate hydratase/2-oxohepta-3-ene-1,7-dioic acid hydratase in catechol pathway